LKADAEASPTSHQFERLGEATRRPVGCLIGGPGSGKTFTLAYLLRAVVAEHGEGSVAVCAPTGKAANRATASLAAAGLGVRATTIHRLLRAKSGGPGGDWEFEAGRDAPLPIRFLVVDEASMNDATLLANLLDSLSPPTKDSPGCHVLLVGDPYQLPPVGHGAPLRDLIASGSVGVGELTEIRRNAGTIVRACASIKAGKSFELANRFDLGTADPANLRHVATGSAEESLSILDDTLTRMAKFDPIRDAQVIVPLNEKSELSRKAINERLAKLLNPDGKRAAGCPFAVGDKVICLKNSQLKPVVPIGRFGVDDMNSDSGNYGPDPSREFDLVVNGEQGFVQAISSKECVISFDGGKGNYSRLVSVPIRRQTSTSADSSDGDEKATGGALGDIDLAYAITVHKSQGSEWPLVIPIVDPAGGMIADRNYWYTAISRAKTACLIIGDAAALAKQVARKSLDRRKTFLVELLIGDGANSE
jgi:ATP-dependent exoDNAse (exonuclease V) alpha subunit